MSEKPTQKFKVLKEDAVIAITVRADFYKLLQELFFYEFNLDPEKATASIQYMSGEGETPPRNPFESKLIILITLLKRLEAAAIEQGLTEEKELEVPKSA